MVVIAKARLGFDVTTYAGIVNIAYDPSTNTYTLTDGDSGTDTIDGNNYYVFILVQNVQ